MGESKRADSGSKGSRSGGVNEQSVSRSDSASRMGAGGR